ncbi:MAG: hypothetical protein R2761_00715 [Acidimicrobiales bacterium]
MANPQQPGVARSRKVGSIAPDALDSELEAQRVVDDTEPQGHVPPENRPGHEHDSPDQVDPDQIASQGDDGPATG